MSELNLADGSNVTVVKAPKAGDHVWFLSNEEMTEGAIFDGEVFEVELDFVRVKVQMASQETTWSLPIEDEDFRIFFSYESLLEDMVKSLLAENRELKEYLRLNN